MTWQLFGWRQKPSDLALLSSCYPIPSIPQLHIQRLGQRQPLVCNQDLAPSHLFEMLIFLPPSLGFWASLVAQMVQPLPAMPETGARSRVGKIPCRRKWQPTPVLLPEAWKIPRTEEPGTLQSMGSQRVGHEWTTSLHFTLGFWFSLVCAANSHPLPYCLYQKWCRTEIQVWNLCDFKLCNN